MTAPPAIAAPLMDKIELIETSISAFFFGVSGIIPFLGTPFGIVALIQNSRIKRRAGSEWNPAQRYLLWGVVCARIGLTLTIIFTLLIVTAILFELLS